MASLNRPFVWQDVAEIIVRLRILRLQAKRLFILLGWPRQTFVSLSGSVGQAAMGLFVPGVEPDCLFQCVIASGSRLCVQQKIAEVIVRLDIARVQTQRGFIPWMASADLRS